MNLSQLRSGLSVRFTQPVARLLARAGVSPNALSISGFIINLGAGAVIAEGSLFWGGVLVLFSALFDLMDGALARASNKVTTFGGILDSTLDRLSEAVVLLGVLILYLQEPNVLGGVLVYLCIAGSLLVSYIKARGEGAGLKCNVGIFTRAERVVALVLGLLLNQVVIALLVIGFLSYYTAAQRLTYLYQQTQKKD